MPSKAKTLGSVLRPGRVPGRLATVQARPSARRRGYGVDHERWAAMVLAARPVCVWPGCTQPAKHADHVIPVAWGGEWYQANGQGLCHAHHNAKTAVETAIARGKPTVAERLRRLYAALPWLPRAALDVFAPDRGR